MKKALFILITIFIFPIIALANNEYDITKYQVDIEVNKNHTYNYSEELDIEFNGNSKYITKTIDEAIHNFKVNKNYTVETDGTSIVKIYTKNTIDKYKMTYNIEEKEKVNNLYKFQIINNYDNDFSAVNFTIVLPNSLTNNNITFYNGKYDITELVDYSVKGRIIKGTYNKPLKQGETLNIEVNYGKFYMNAATLICIVVPIFLTVFSYLLWRLFGKDLPTKIEKVSKFTRNITPLHIALAENGKVTNEDTFYLLLHLASKGYLTIHEEKNEYYFTKEKDYKESNYTEAMFFKTLFRAGESITLTEYLNILSEKRDNKTKIYQADRVESKNIKRKFKYASETIQKYLDDQNEQYKYFEETPEKIKNVLLLMIALILVLITSLPFIEINVLALLPLSIIMSIAILYLLVKFVININIKSKEDKAIIGFTGATILLILALIPSLQRNIGFSIAFLTSFICSVIILFIYKYMPKRTIYGQSIYNKAEGFKYFIKTVKKEELLRIVELNEDYLLDILPTAYQLGVSNKVIEILKRNNITPPEWYKIPNKFNYARLNTSILNLKEILTKQDEEL